MWKHYFVFGGFVFIYRLCYRSSLLGWAQQHSSMSHCLRTIVFRLALLKQWHSVTRLAHGEGTNSYLCRLHRKSFKRLDLLHGLSSFNIPLQSVILTRVELELVSRALPRQHFVRTEGKQGRTRLPDSRSRPG